MERDDRDRLFPIFVKLAGKVCTLVGGGDVAARKVRSLLDSGARVRIIAPRLCASLGSLVRSGQAEHVARNYEQGDLAGSVLAFGATDDRSVNDAVRREGESLGILVNVVDQPDLCSFYVPSALARGPIEIAISTEGTSPALARRLREMLEGVILPEHGQLAALLGSLRAEVKAAFPSSREREARWRSVVDSEVLALLREGKQEEARAVARRLLGLASTTERGPDALDTVRIGTRGSALALAQARATAACLRQAGVNSEIITIRTTGDRRTEIGPDSPIGMFVREIEQALVRGDVDLAVHSMKDLPTGARPGLVVAAVLPREDPSDVIITRDGQGLDELPPGSRVATSSPRRVAQLRVHRPDLVFVPVKGNVDTRLRKLERGDFDALVLAYAGLARLDLSDAVTERLPYDICLPAPGQGALALQVREEDTALRRLLEQFDHEPSRLAVTAERAFLAGVGGGCSVPAGALGVIEGDRLILRGVLEAEEAGLIRDQVEGPPGSASELGVELAERVLAATQTRIATDQP
jgi:hydroxymethylbilane synthase